MRGLTVAIIILALIIFTTSASALSMPSLFGSMTSFPAISTNINPISTFSFGTSNDGSVITNNPLTDMSSVSSIIDGTSTIPVIIGNPSNSIQNLPVGLDSGFQWPGVGYNKWTAHGVTPPSNYIQPSETVSATPTPIPDITQAQKDEALKIAATSPLCKEYNSYPDESWMASWGSPYDGHTIGVFTTLSNGYIFEIWVNIDNGTIVNTLYQPNKL